MELRQYHVINTQKISTAFFILACMFYFNNWSIEAYIYLVMHGSYGFCWMIKHFCFPSASTFKAVDTPVFIVLVILLFVLYWGIPILAISNKNPASSPFLAMCCTMYIFGLVIMLVSDCQMYFSLKYNPGKLITTGCFSMVRQPNYAGEILLYLSICLLSRSWASFLLFGIGFVVVIYPTMINKEKRLSRYPEWKEYSDRTGICLPPPKRVLDWISSELAVGSVNDAKNK